MPIALAAPSHLCFADTGMNIRFVLFALVAAILAGVLAYNASIPSSSLPIGSVVCVQVHGASAPFGFPTMNPDANGTATYIMGKLVSVDRDWVVLDLPNTKRVWMKRSAVLLIQVTD